MRGIDEVGPVPAGGVLDAGPAGEDGPAGAALATTVRPPQVRNGKSRREPVPVPVTVVRVWEVDPAEGCRVQRVAKMAALADVPAESVVPRAWVEVMGRMQSGRVRSYTAGEFRAALARAGGYRKHPPGVDHAVARVDPLPHHPPLRVVKGEDVLNCQA